VVSADPAPACSVPIGSVSEELEPAEPELVEPKAGEVLAGAGAADAGAKAGLLEGL